MAVILDAGALIAIDNQDRTIGAILRVAQRNAVPIRTSSAVVAQVWRKGARQANLARILAGVEERALDHSAARRIGELLRSSDAADVVDGHVATLAFAGDTVLTSDPGDIQHLLDNRALSATILPV